jgi:ABC-type nitrate/sulfonate/bicarbonate transport system substrate-binding protein
MMSNDFIKKNPNAPKKVIQSFVDAYDFYRKNITQSNKWFVEDSKLKISDNVFAICSALEPNLFVQNRQDIRMDFNQQDLVSLQKASDFLYKQ